MRHYILTRSVYGPDWPIAANRRRLNLLRGITAASLKAQTERRFEWIVLLHPDDELHDERIAACETAGVPVTFRYFKPERMASRARIAAQAYKFCAWAVLLYGEKEVKLTTRLDDDDALTPCAVRRIQEASWDLKPPIPLRRALILPNGFRVWDGRYEAVTHNRNAWATLLAPPGDDAVIYDFNHKRIAEHVEVHMVDEEGPAWLWVRHEDTLSDHRKAEHPIDDELRAEFPGLEWSLL